MNGAERILAAARLQPTDRLPVMPQVFGHAARLQGIPLGDYLRDGELVARCQVAAWRRYGYDAVFGFLDAGVEAEALGGRLLFHPEHYPVVADPPLDVGADVARLEPPDPQRAGRMPQALVALRRLRAETAGEALVLGCVQGPATLAAQFLEMETALFLAADDPARFAALLDFTTACAIRYGIAQIKAGADFPLVFEPVASPIVLPPALFESLLLPRLRRLFAALAAAGARSSWLHIAGRSAAILPLYRSAGVEIATFDYCVDAETARDLVPDLCLCGNLKPLAFVEETPEAIERQAAQLAAVFAGRPGFILSTGCEIPPEARPDTIEAMVRVVRRGVGG